MDPTSLSREVNDRTYEVIVRFSGPEPPDEVLAEFLCECGCLNYVALPLTRYVDSGAWIDEHRRGGLSRRPVGASSARRRR